MVLILIKVLTAAFFKRLDKVSGPDKGCSFFIILIFVVGRFVVAVRLVLATAAKPFFFDFLVVDLVLVLRTLGDILFLCKKMYRRI